MPPIRRSQLRTQKPIGESSELEPLKKEKEKYNDSIHIDLTDTLDLHINTTTSTSSSTIKRASSEPNACTITPNWKGKEKGLYLRPSPVTFKGGRIKISLSLSPNKERKEKESAATSSQDYDELLARQLQQEADEEFTKNMYFEQQHHFQQFSSIPDLPLESRLLNRRRSHSSSSRRRRSMSLNIDGMSYEQLLQLEESMGSVSTGVSEPLLNSSTQISSFHSSNQTETCTICLTDFSEGDSIRRLPCLHCYHLDCIDQWLKDKNKCPTCLAPISG